MTIGIFIDHGFKPEMIPRTPPQQPLISTGRPVITEPISLANIMRLIPEHGFNWFILEKLWTRREEKVVMWQIINSLADEVRDPTRAEKRAWRRSILGDMDRLIQSGWVIRHGKRIQLNLIRLSGHTGL